MRVFELPLVLQRDAVDVLNAEWSMVKVGGAIPLSAAGRKDQRRTRERRIIGRIKRYGPRSYPALLRSTRKGLVRE